MRRLLTLHRHLTFHFSDGADDSIGLSNGSSGAFYTSGPQTPNDTVGLHNSWHHA